MEKKLLLACMLFGSSMLCTEGEQNLKEELSLEDQKKIVRILIHGPHLITDKAFEEVEKEELLVYEANERILYREMYVKTLADDPEALAKKIKDNETHCEEEEKDNKKKQDDTVIGTWGSAATKKSFNGRMLAYFIDYKKAQHEINSKLKQLSDSHKDAFVKTVRPIFEEEVIRRNYTMKEEYIRGLKRCRCYAENKDEKGFSECLISQNIFLDKIQMDGFFDNFIYGTFRPVVNEVKNEKLPLTDEEVIEICKKINCMDSDGKSHSIQILSDSTKTVKEEIATLLNLLYEKKVMNDEKILNENDYQQHENNPVDGEQE